MSTSLASIIYKCARCGTERNLEELSRFPEPECKNCGYRVLKKLRSPSTAKLQPAV